MTPVLKLKLKKNQLQLYTYFDAIQVKISPQTTCSFQLELLLCTVFVAI